MIQQQARFTLTHICVGSLSISVLLSVSKVALADSTDMRSRSEAARYKAHQRRRGRRFPRNNNFGLFNAVKVSRDAAEISWSQMQHHENAQG